MKKVKTFILRVLVYSERSGEVCGSVQPVSTGEVYAFKSEQALMDILRDLSGETQSIRPASEPADEGQGEPQEG